jgi:hypothetical protein
MDLDTVRRILDNVLAQAPHLPRPASLAATIHTTYHQDAQAQPAARLAAVVAVLWPIAAVAGASRGYTIAAAALRTESAKALADPNLDARGRWVVAGLKAAADQLPPQPRPAPTRPPTTIGRVRDPETGLRQALAIGLGHAWRSGHDHACDQAIAGFLAAAVDLIGEQRLATTFLLPTLPASSLLDELGYLAYRAGESDREHPPTQAGTGKAFAAAPRIHLTPRRDHNSLSASWRAGSGPRHRGPGR